MYLFISIIEPSCNLGFATGELRSSGSWDQTIGIIKTKTRDFHTEDAGAAAAPLEHSQQLMSDPTVFHTRTHLEASPQGASEYFISNEQIINSRSSAEDKQAFCGSLALIPGLEDNTKGFDLVAGSPVAPPPPHPTPRACLFVCFLKNVMTVKI